MSLTFECRERKVKFVKITSFFAYKEKDKVTILYHTCPYQIIEKDTDEDEISYVGACTFSANDLKKEPWLEHKGIFAKGYCFEKDKDVMLQKIINLYIKNSKT